MNFFRKPRAVAEPHKHVYDSDNGIETIQIRDENFAAFFALKCSCGLGRVFHESQPASISEYLKRRRA